jgi:hypothetical protein
LSTVFDLIASLYQLSSDERVRALRLKLIDERL